MIEKTMKEITGTDYYKGGLYNPGTVMTNPALFIRKLGEGLNKFVNIYENSPVIKKDREGLDWKLFTPKGSVTSRNVILTVNGHIESFGYYKNSLMNVFTYASMTRKLLPNEIKLLKGEKLWSITPSDIMGTTLRKISGIGGDRILIRNSWSYNSNMETTKKIMSRALNNNIKSFNNRFLLLKNVKIDYSWGGRSCLTLNNTHAFGEVDKNMFSACCQNILGTVSGTFNGMTIVDYAAKGNSPFVHDMLNLEKPKKLLPKIIMDIGGNLALKWKEFKAGKEK